MASWRHQLWSSDSDSEWHTALLREDEGRAAQSGDSDTSSYSVTEDVDPWSEHESDYYTLSPGDVVEVIPPQTALGVTCRHMLFRKM